MFAVFKHPKLALDAAIENFIDGHLTTAVIKSIDDLIVSIGIFLPAFMVIGGILPAALNSNCGIPRLACFPSTPDNDAVMLLGILFALGGGMLAVFAAWLHGRFSEVVYWRTQVR